MDGMMLAANWLARFFGVFYISILFTECNGSHLNCPDVPVHYGTDNYIQYCEGNCGIIITSPHGGRSRPDFESAPEFDKTGGANPNGTCLYDYMAVLEYGADDNCKVPTKSDWNTDKLAYSLYEKIRDITNQICKPHLIVNKLHRTKLDANRAIGVATFNVEEAMTAWEEFHGFIDAASTSVNATQGRGLLLDIHAQNKKVWVELGYSISGNDLDAGILITEESSIRNLASFSNFSFSDLLAGNYTSLGYYLQTSGDVVPSPMYPSPNGEHYYGGTGGAYPSASYITPTHGSKYGGTIDAIQIESPSSYIKSTSDRVAYAATLASAVVDFYDFHYPN